MNMNAKTETAPENGETVFIPLNLLKKHPKNARKTPHSAVSIEQKAASIAAKGILQNLVVEPELDAAGEATGFYLVAIGEGRRQAQLLRVKRKQIKKTEPIRCMIDTTNDPFEISLDENFNHETMHPADLFEAYWTLHVERGWGPEEIAARGGGSPQSVRRLFRLANVSPRLIQTYRDGDLTMEQLQAFVKRRPKLTPDRRPILTPSLGTTSSARGRSWSGLRSPASADGLAVLIRRGS